MKEKDNTSSQPAPRSDEPVRSAGNAEQQEQDQVQFTEVKNASPSGLGSIGRSAEPLGEEGEGGEY
ncbi:MAG TPA: hypothetical protein VGB46_10800 [Flavisolibacter sp.]|jgi:hypothetical protein